MNLIWEMNEDNQMTVGKEEIPTYEVEQTNPPPPLNDAKMLWGTYVRVSRCLVRKPRQGPEFGGWETSPVENLADPKTEPCHAQGKAIYIDDPSLLMVWIVVEDRQTMIYAYIDDVVPAEDREMIVPKVDGLNWRKRQ